MRFGKRRPVVVGFLAAFALLMVASGVQFMFFSVATLNSAKNAVNAGENLLGFNGPRSYLVAFQNPAEARGTGGIIGAYAIIKMDHGHITVQRRGSDADLSSRPRIPIAMPAEFTNIYGQDPAIWQNSNMSPHFPDAAKIWLALWQKQSKEKLDGVLAVDPRAISAMLNTLGAVRLADGELVTASNVQKKTMSDAYRRFATDNQGRKDYLVSIMGLVLRRISALSIGQKVDLARALVVPAQQRHIIFYSTHAATEAVVDQFGFSGALDSTASNDYQATLINTDASKLDYYTRLKVNLKQMSCQVGAAAKLTIRVTNGFDGKTKLPDYVWGRLDKHLAHGLGGAHALTLMIFSPPGSTLAALQRDHFDLGVGEVAVERRHPTLALHLDLKPGESETISATFTGASGPIKFVPPVMVNDPQVFTSGAC